MPRIYYSDYETYVNVNIDYDEDIDTIYNNCSHDEKLWLAEHLIEEEYLEQLRNNQPAPATDSQNESLAGLELLVEKIFDHPQTELEALPDELIDRVRTWLNTPVATPSRITQPTILREIKSLSQTMTDANPTDSIQQELNLLIQTL